MGTFGFEGHETFRTPTSFEVTLRHTRGEASCLPTTIQPGALGSTITQGYHIHDHHCQGGEVCNFHEQILSGPTFGHTKKDSIEATEKEPQGSNAVDEKIRPEKHVCRGGEACTHHLESDEEIDSEPDSEELEELASTLTSNHPGLRTMIERHLDVLNRPKIEEIPAELQQEFRAEIDRQKFDNTFGHYTKTKSS